MADVGMGIEQGDLILFAADQWLNACEILGKIRLYCADVLKTQGKLVIPADQFNFLWVIEFPLLGFDRDGWQAEFASIGEYLQAFGARTPQALKDEQQRIAARLAG